MSRKVLSLLVLATAFTTIVGVTTDAEAGRRRCRSQNHTSCQSSNYGHSNCGQQHSWNDGCQQTNCCENRGGCVTHATCCCVAQSGCTVTGCEGCGQSNAQQPSTHTGRDNYGSGSGQYDGSQPSTIEVDAGASTPRSAIDVDEKTPSSALDAEVSTPATPIDGNEGVSLP